MKLSFHFVLNVLLKKKKGLQSSPLVSGNIMTHTKTRTHRAQRGLCLSNGQNNTHHEYSSTCFLPETTHYLAMQFTKPDANWIGLCVFMCAFERARQSRRSVEIEFCRENQSRDDLKLIATTLAPTPVTVSPPFPPLSSPSSLVLLNQVWQTPCFTLSLSHLNTGPYRLSVLARTGDSLKYSVRQFKTCP